MHSFLMIGARILTGPRHSTYHAASLFPRVARQAQSTWKVAAWEDSEQHDKADFVYRARTESSRLEG